MIDQTNYIKRFYEQESKNGSYSPLIRNVIKTPYWWTSVDDRLEEISLKLNHYLKDKSNQKILDIACGDGIFEAILDQKIRDNNSFVGVDISENQKEKSKKYFDQFVIIDISQEKLPFDSNTFDVVILSEVLEHVFHPENVIAEIRRVLKPGGYLFFSCPNLSSLDNRFSMFFLGTSEFIDYARTKQHIRFFTIKTLRNLFVGFKIYYYQGTGILALPRIIISYRINLPRFIQKFVNRKIKKCASGIFIIFRKK